MATKQERPTLKTNRAAALAMEAPVSHNLLGQRLGRKGLVTRQRILTAAQYLLDNPDTTISLSAVAREASLSMAAIYLYFADLTELLLALLAPAAAMAEASHIADLREHWEDDEVHERCLGFIRAYRAYWEAHSGLFLLRNQLADGGDLRMKKNRVDASKPLIALIVNQMGGAHDRRPFNHRAMAAVLTTGIDRVITVHLAGVTLPAEIPDNYVEEMPDGYVEDVLVAQARLLEFSIREGRLHSETALAR